MPFAASPDIKLLAGDQVYLDSPWGGSIRSTTTATTSAGSLSQELRVDRKSDERICAAAARDGANFFSSDDHEYWNNAPNAARYS